jgi:hypothetical protein
VEDYYFLPHRAAGPASNAVYFLRPAAEGEKVGGQAELVPAYGVCVYLGASGCTLPRGAMPIGCVTALPCRPGRGREVDKEQAPAVWGGAPGQAVIALYEAWARARDPQAAVGPAALAASVRAASNEVGVGLMSAGVALKRLMVAAARAKLARDG